MDMAEEEAASRAVAATLSGVSPHVRKGYQTTLEGKKIEIDVLARFGDTCSSLSANIRCCHAIRTNCGLPMTT